MIVVDSFLSDFSKLQSHASIASFSSEVNGVDGAVYPAIHFDIPDDIQADFIRRIEEERGFHIDPKLVFLRANPLGESEPYQAHNDLNMGEYTCILYLTNEGGTSFLKHKETGMDRNDPDFSEIWARDCNNYNAWSVNDFCEMKPNRALLFDAEMMHRGEPVEGYGEGNYSRMIMVCFYDRAAIC